jgi:hypothetical protein
MATKKKTTAKKDSGLEADLTAILNAAKAKEKRLSKLPKGANISAGAKSAMASILNALDNIAALTKG